MRSTFVITPLAAAVFFAFAGPACRSSNRDQAPAEPPAPAAPAVEVRISPVSLPAGPGSMAASLTAVGDDTVLATWLEPAPEDPGGAGGDAESAVRLRFARYRDGAFGEPATVVESPRLLRNWADTPLVSADAGGALYAYYLEITDPETFAYDARAARSTDQGASWSLLGKVHGDAVRAEHGFVSAVAEGAGVRSFWLDGRAAAEDGDSAGHEHRGAMTLRTGVASAQVAPDALIDDRVCDCCGTATAMTAGGPVVVYRDRSADEVRDIAIVRSVGGQFTRPAPVHRDGWKVEGCPVNGPRVVADGRAVAVAWYTYADKVPRVRVAFSQDAGASFGAPVEVDAPAGTRAPMGRVDLALVGPGEVVVTWLASDREDALVLARRVAADGRVGAALPLVETRAGRTAGVPRLARAAGRLLLAYTHVGAGAGASTEARVVSLEVSAVPALEARTQAIAAGAGGSGLPAVGQDVSAYRAVDLSGAPVSLADLSGAPVLVNVWATWCEPCRHELPELVRLHDAYAGRGLRVVGASVDPADSRADVERFVKAREVPYAIWLDPDDLAGSALGAAVLPVSILVDGRGRVVFAASGAIDADDADLRAAIERLLAN